MQVSRRWITFSGAMVILAGCSSSGGAKWSTAQDPQFRPQANPKYDAWVASFQNRAKSSGISQTTLNAAFKNAGYLAGVVERDRNQTEFARSLEDYLAIVSPQEKVTAGRSKLKKNARLLSAIESRYGVPANVVAAIWGVESNYGARRGDISVIASTSTLAYDGRRGAFFEKQLMAALRILQKGDVSASNLVGSWAGAMGHTQFIPTSFEAYAVDFKGDGRRDIWSDDPTDALASAAAYLAKSGWRRGQPWGQEVRLPVGFNTGLAGRGKRRSTAQWTGQGVRNARGGALTDYGSAALLLPSGKTGPAFLVYRNFDVILRYNNSINYGIGVGYLSDRIAGSGPLTTRFPPDKHGLSIQERQRLQAQLSAKGFDTGGTDGVIGPKTEAAIRAYQKRVGLPVTGNATRQLLETLG